MILEKIYNESYLKRKEEIIERYIEEKNIVAKGKLPVFQKKFQKKINQEFVELFSQNTDEKSEYHFIEKFSHKMPGIEDSFLTFDEDFINTKDLTKNEYKDHGYGPKVDIFFKQSDEDIAKKLGHFQAYNELRTGFLQSMIKSERKEITNNTLGENNNVVEPGAGKVGNEVMFTSIRQIADYFNCSIPTAQKIKNRIPKDQYWQEERTFAVRESVLLKNR